MARRSLSSKINSWLWGILLSLAGVVVGVVLIVSMVGLLFWNEASVVRAERAAALASEISTSADIMVWTIRSVGLALLVAGFALIGGPLSAFANIISGFGAMVRFGTAFFAGMLGLGVGTLTLALAWLFYLPWTAALIVLTGAAVILAIAYIGIRIADIRYKASETLLIEDEQAP